MTDVIRTAETVHETAGVRFHVVSGEVQATSKEGYNLPTTTITNLLLLDIAQSLADIRRWGIAQDADCGQRTFGTNL